MMLYSDAQIDRNGYIQYSIHVLLLSLSIYLGGLYTNIYKCMYDSMKVSHRYIVILPLSWQLS